MFVHLSPNTVSLSIRFPIVNVFGANLVSLQNYHLSVLFNGVRYDITVFCEGESYKYYFPKAFKSNVEVDNDQFSCQLYYLLEVQIYSRFSCSFRI